MLGGDKWSFTLFKFWFSIVPTNGSPIQTMFEHVGRSGADPEISERGGRKPNPRKGGGLEFDFSVRLSVIFL